MKQRRRIGSLLDALRGPLLPGGLLVALVALLSRLVACSWGASRVPPTADGAFYHVVAQRIAALEGYTWLWPDGVVTPAAHYPVGYPAVVGALYSAFGAMPLVAMLFNALLGTAGVLAIFLLSSRLLRDCGVRPRIAKASSLAVGLALALAPTLVMYTPAMMTESNVGALCALAFLLGDSARRAGVETERPRVASPRRWRGTPWVALVGAGLLLGIATLMRPQSVLLAPFLGWCASSSWRWAVVRALVATLVCLVVVLPWTARNCEKMERCVFVSANGGWNLLIGTFPEGEGSWVELSGERVPTECREVFQEAAKDKCFGQAALAKIRRDSASWVGLMPLKLRATFDYSAAAAPHLAEAGALARRERVWLEMLEYGHQRVMALLALVGAWSLALPEPRGRDQRRLPSQPATGKSQGRGSARGLGRPGALGAGLLGAVAAVGAIGFVGVSAPLGWAAFVALCLLSGRSAWRPSVALGWGTVGSTALVYAVFFGAGRYGVPIWYAVGPIAARGAATLASTSAWIRGKGPGTRAPRLFDRRHPAGR